jgi:hypothetical protein
MQDELPFVKRELRDGQRIFDEQNVLVSCKDGVDLEQLMRKEEQRVADASGKRARLKPTSASARADAAN